MQYHPAIAWQRKCCFEESCRVYYNNQLDGNLCWEHLQLNIAAEHGRYMGFVQCGVCKWSKQNWLYSIVYVSEGGVFVWKSGATFCKQADLACHKSWRACCLLPYLVVNSIPACFHFLTLLRAEKFSQCMIIIIL